MGHFAENSPLARLRRELAMRIAADQAAQEARAIAAAHEPDLITKMGANAAARDGVEGEWCSVSAYRSGELFVGPVVPDGALELVQGVRELLWCAIWGSARKGYDGDAWLVPGIPEADSDDEALEALISYQKRIIARVKWLEGGTSVAAADAVGEII